MRAPRSIGVLCVLLAACGSTGERAALEERDLVAEIEPRVHEWTLRLSREAAEATFEEALAYVDGDMTGDVIARVRGDLQEVAPGIEDAEVCRLWEEAPRHRSQLATYGTGTWLLGEERALATYDQEEKQQEPDPQKGSAAEARRRLEERVQRYLEEQELARRAHAASGEEDPDELWRRWSPSDRAQWIRAYFAEFSGAFEVESVRFEFCRECGGSGTRTVLFTGRALVDTAAGEQIVPCGTCHTLGHVRRIRYR